VGFSGIRVLLTQLDVVDVILPGYDRARVSSAPVVIHISLEDAA